MAEVLAALSLGGNVGDVAAAFGYALDRLSAQSGVRLMSQSSVWRTRAWGKTDQPDFLNMAALVRTRLSPHELLALCLSIEKERGRERGERWGPRTLDIDVLTYGDAIINEPGLAIPHPRLHERAFVLAPLAQIAPELQIGGQSARDHANRINSDDVKIDVAATAFMRSCLPS